MTDPGATLLLNVDQWPRHRRIAMTGRNNVNFRHGRYTNKRRWRLEKPLNHAMRDLSAFGLQRLQLRIARLPKPTVERAKVALDRLGEFFPGRWALADPRRPESSPAFYIPRRAWALCARWLRLWRELQRLVFWGASLISAPMPAPTGEEQKGPIREALSGGVNDRRRLELERYRAWCARQGLSVEPTA